ncbi:MAG: undecaprenyl-diphosphate phosphatase [Candidatus Hodarchaeota archaeon]
MIEYIIIAIIQGLVEWLPISSSGQVMIVSINFFGISSEAAFSLSIWLHLGTTFAVILKFRGEYVNIIKALIPNKFNANEIAIKNRNWIIYATIGTAIVAIPLYLIFRIIILGTFKASQGDILTLIISGLLILTGIFLLKFRKNFGTKTIENINNNQLKKDSFLSGLFQGAAILPGISRSGFTVSAIMLEKYEQDKALKLSFLMSVPVALASIGVDIIFGEGSVFGVLNPIIILLVTAISFVIGYLSMEFLLKIAKKVEFGYFCIFYGIISFIIILPIMVIAI